MTRQWKIILLIIFLVNTCIVSAQSLISSSNCIIGYTPNSQVLDDWMEKMNRYEWVESVELLNYLESTNSKAEFKLLISFSK